MVITSFSALFIFLYKAEKSTKLFYLGMSIVSVYALSVNYSRTSQLSFLLTALIFTAIFLKNKQSLKLYVISFIIIGVSIITFSQNDKIMQKFNNVIPEIEKAYNIEVYEGNFGVRLYFNKIGLEIIKNNFFFGMGPVDNRNELIKREAEDKHYKERIIKHFHSEHMEILTAYGFIGYSLIFSAIVLLLYKLRDDKLYFNIGLSVYLTLFFVSFANKTLALKPLNYVYIIFFVLLSIIAYNNEQKKSLTEGVK
ncbi:O-antigen ligase family protein [Sulfurimonas sp. SAG-AH-194-C20]|nr:O-antigen ligase family protein [Sulfurimonas sp. SAG-AH-194-C20]